MAFDFANWGTAGGQSSVGRAFQIFTYKTNDTLAEITTAGYFNPNRGNIRKNDLIIIHREDIDEQNPLDFTIRVTTVPTGGDITVVVSQSDDWNDDGSKIFPAVDGRDVSTGSGDLITNDGTFNALAASKIVHTNGTKKLVSIDINTAYNKNFKTNTPAPDSDAGSAGSELTPPKGNHSHPKVTATTTVRGQVELATNAETQAGTDTERAVTPAGLESKTATETRKGIAEVATQTETNTGTDDERIVTPKKLNDRIATETLSGIAEIANTAEAEAGTDDTRIMTPAKVKDYTDANIVEDAKLTRVIIENDTTDPNNDIEFNSGRMWSDNGVKRLNLPNFIKRLDASFVAGTNQGMLGDTVTKTANTWYHLFGIEKDSDGSTDYYADTDFSAANIPTGYSNPVYIWSIKTDGSSNIYGLIHKGNRAYWKQRMLDLSTTSVSTSRTAITLSVPPDFPVIAIISVNLQDAAEAAIFFGSDGQEDVAPLEGTGPTISQTRNIRAAGDEEHDDKQLLTNSSSQIYYRASQATADAFVVNTLGWIPVVL